MTFKAFNMEKIIQVLHRMTLKSCQRACQLFCCPIDSLWRASVTWCPAQGHQSTEDQTTQMAIRSPPSTILIVNISNSTLIDCVIGDNTYPAAVAESQPLMTESELQMHANESPSRAQQGAAQNSRPPPPRPPPPPLASSERARINIKDSYLKYVIIGDNNDMHVEQSPWIETDDTLD
ncbi:uncharacterized protein V6R79_018904 [Siganus canaliculatus]